jgi:hypothetical protein
MPSWGQILGEIVALQQQNDQFAFDKIRKKYLKLLFEYTKRNTIIYASRWTSGDLPPQLVSLTDEDIQGFMESAYGLKGDKLDLLLHTGGGSAEATEAIVSYLRQKFMHIRIIIPQAAMSAGTMLALSADEIVMGKQSSIGPIDPQFILQTSVGVQALPAQAILEQFNLAQKDCSDNPKHLSSWIPMLNQYGPALLVRCKNQIEFSQELAKNWLNSYMFKGQKSDMPNSISEFLSDHKNFKTHGKHLNMEEARNLGLKIISLEEDNKYQDKVLSAFHATMHTISGTNTIKIIASHNGNSFLKQFRVAPEIRNPNKNS